MSRDRHIPGLSPSSHGKVKDLYDLGEYLLIVATDRLSVSDVVMPTAIPQKGRIQTQLSAFWFQRTGHIIPNHEVDIRIESLAKGVPPDIAARSTVARKTAPLPLEAVVLGYVAGSAWREYSETGTVGGLPQPPNLRMGDKLPEPLFLPRLKAPISRPAGSLTFADLCDLVGTHEAAEIRAVSLLLYRFGADWAAARDITLADAQFEFGRGEGGLVLIDEALTPDSSRFWDTEASQAEDALPVRLDKRHLLDWLAAIRWDRCSLPPDLPHAVVMQTSAGYREVFKRLTGPARKPIPPTP